jgi:hypothetical protein
MNGSFLQDKRTMSNTFLKFLGKSNTPTVIYLFLQIAINQFIMKQDPFFDSEMGNTRFLTLH